MKYSKIRTIIVFSAALILLSSCSNKSETRSKANESKSKNTSYVFESVDTEDTSTEEIGTDVSGNIIQEEESKFPIAELKINKSNIYEMNDVIETDDTQMDGSASKIRLSINNVTISSDLPDGVTKDQVDYFQEKIDETGKLLNKKYIIIDLLVKNECDNKTLYMASSGNFIEMNSEGKVIDSCSEVRYQSYYDSTTQGIKDGNKIYFEPYEEKLVKIIYISNISMSESKDLYYMIDTEGSTFGTDIKAFKIDN